MKTDDLEPRLTNRLAGARDPAAEFALGTIELSSGAAQAEEAGLLFQALLHQICHAAQFLIDQTELQSRRGQFGLIGGDLRLQLRDLLVQNVGLTGERQPLAGKDMRLTTEGHGDFLFALALYEFRRKPDPVKVVALGGEPRLLREQSDMLAFKQIDLGPR